MQAIHLGGSMYKYAQDLVLVQVDIFFRNIYEHKTQVQVLVLILVQVFRDNLSKLSTSNVFPFLEEIRVNSLDYNYA